MNAKLAAIFKKHPLPWLENCGHDDYSVYDKHGMLVPTAQLAALANVHAPEPAEERYYVEAVPSVLKGVTMWSVCHSSSGRRVWAQHDDVYPDAKAAAEREAERLNAECKPDPAPCVPNASGTVPHPPCDTTEIAAELHRHVAEQPADQPAEPDLPERPWKDTSGADEIMADSADGRIIIRWPRNSSGTRRVDSEWEEDQRVHRHEIQCVNAIAELAKTSKPNTPWHTPLLDALLAETKVNAECKLDPPGEPEESLMQTGISAFLDQAKANAVAIGTARELAEYTLVDDTPHRKLVDCANTLLKQLGEKK